LLKLLSFLKPYSPLTAGVLVFMFVHALSELYLPTLLAGIVDIGIVGGDSAYIFRTGALMLTVAIGGVITTIVGNLLSSRAAAGFGKDLRRSLFSRIESFSLQEFDRFGSASLITRSTNDVTQVQMVLLLILRMMVSAPLMLAGGMIMALSRDAQLSRVLIVVIPLLAVAVTLIALKAVPAFKSMQLDLDRLNLVLRENLTGMRVIRAFNRLEQEKQRFNEVNLDLTATAIRVNRLLASIMPVLMLTLNFTAVAIIWFGGMRIDRGQMMVGDLIAFLQYVMLILFSLIMVSMTFVMLPRASASAARINQVLDTFPNLIDPPHPQNGGGAGGVEFKEATFSYPGAENPAVNKISFRAKPGEITALIGGTGSGKSTLAKLLLRFYDVDSGAIYLGGVDVREISQATLRDKIGYVPQQSFLFSGSVADNIRFGRKEATDEEVRQAAETAQAADFIADMTGGYSAIIAKGGSNVSGGQKQRLSIARALAKQPEIYIFDDSFSALDFKTEFRIRAALKKETASATVLVIAQRVGTVMDADQILVLDNGKICGAGKHAELLKTCAVYREIVLSQLSAEEVS
jgi:ATP-binding cassette subfamily B protein